MIEEWNLIKEDIGFYDIVKERTDMILPLLQRIKKKKEKSFFDILITEIENYDEKELDFYKEV